MQNIGKNIQKHTGVGVIILALLAWLVGGINQPAAAQIVTPTPLPQVVATKQAADAANQQVSDLQAQRTQTEARLAEINRNIEAQIAEAERAAADARTAAATQNAVEAGAAIGRLEGALAQLRDSYAGKDAIISEQMSRIEQQATQSAADKRTIDDLTLELQQAKKDKQAALKAYDDVKTNQTTNQVNNMVGNAVLLIVALALIFAVIAFAAFVLPRRRAVMIEPPPDGFDKSGATDGDYTEESA